MKKSTTVLLLIIALILFFLQLIFSSVYLPLTTLWKALTDPTSDSTAHFILWNSRIPSAIVSVLAGAALSTAGMCMQAIFRNPLAGPYVLGISSGSSLGVAMLVLGSSWLSVSELKIHPAGLVLSALVGAGITFSWVYMIWSRVRQSVGMLIIGMMLSGLIQSLIDILQASSNGEDLRNFILWTFGSFSHAGLTDCVWLSILILLSLFGVYRLIPGLNLVLLGDEQASTAGLNIYRFKKQVALLTCVLTASITAFCGPIAFVGLAAPHLARLVAGSSEHRTLFLPSIFTGIILCEICNLVQHVGILGYHVPLNALLSLVGSPFIIWLILRKKGNALLQ